MPRSRSQANQAPFDPEDLKDLEDDPRQFLRDVRTVLLFVAAGLALIWAIALLLS